MKSIQIILSTVATLTLVMGMAACKPKEEGPAEKAGQSMDKAMDNAGEKVEQMGKDMQDKAEGQK
jgi:hyperosmotically inducible protein